MRAVLTRAAVWCSQGTLRVRWLGFFPSFPVWGHFSSHTCPRDPLFPVLPWLFGAAAHLHPLTQLSLSQQPGPCPGIIPCCFPAGADTSSPPSSWWAPSGAGTQERTASLCPRGLSSGDSSVWGWQPCFAQAGVTALLCTPTRAKHQTCTSGCGRYRNRVWMALPRLWKGQEGKWEHPSDLIWPVGYLCLILPPLYERINECFCWAT